MNATLWDVQAGREARDEAVSRVEASSAPWGALALLALERVAYRQPTVTSDDVWAELDAAGLPRPAEGRAMGPVMVRGTREKLIEPEGFTQGTNPRHHADVMRVYRSLVYR